MSPTPRESLGKKGHQHAINALTISMDSLWAVSRSWDSDLILWNIHLHTPIYHWKWRDNSADPVISPDNQFIAGLAEGKYLLLYNLQSPASPLTELVLPRNSEVEYCRPFPCRACVWSADGMQLVIYISTLSHEQVLVFSRLPSWTLHRCISFERPGDKKGMLRPKLSLDDGNQFLVAWEPTDKKPYQIWDLTRGTLHYQPFPSYWNEESDGLLINSYRHYAIYTSYGSNNPVTSEVFDMLAIRSLAILPLTRRVIAQNGIGISPDQSRIVLLFGDATVKTWNLATQTEIHSFQDSYAVAAPWHGVAAYERCRGRFSPDGRYVLLCYDRAAMRLLRVDDGACLATFALHSWPQHFQFSPDGMTLCYTMDDESGCVYFEPIGHLLS
ncbi:Quino protein amine dehydrogenase [Earliella scabrosa]|nr:Quino protein amine dehydrogenase [Earliella scabrosa]